MEDNCKDERKRVVGVIKNMKGKDVPSDIKKEKGIKDSDYVNLVFKENSPRTKDYDKSYGRFLDLVINL